MMTGSCISTNSFDSPDTHRAVPLAFVGGTRACTRLTRLSVLSREDRSDSRLGPHAPIDG